MKMFAELGMGQRICKGTRLRFFQAYAAYGGAVGVGGVASQTALGQILNIAPYTAGNNQIVNATNGWVTIMHSIARIRQWSCRSNQHQGNHGFDVTSTDIVYPALLPQLSERGDVSGFCPDDAEQKLRHSDILAGGYQFDGGWNQQPRLVTTSSDHGFTTMRLSSSPVTQSPVTTASGISPFRARPAFVAGLDLQRRQVPAGRWRLVTPTGRMRPWTVNLVTNSGGLQKSRRQRRMVW